MVAVARRSRIPGKIDPAALGAFDPSIIAWAASFYAGDPLWSNPGEGGAVSSWRNGGTLGGNATQAAGANQPVWSATSIGGRPGVTFDGTNDTLSISLSDLNTTPLSVVAVLKLLTASGVQVAIGLSGSGARYAPAAISGVWYGRLHGVSGGVAASGGTTDTNPHLFSTVGKATGTTLKLAKDGTDLASSSSASAVPDLASPQTLYLGSDNGSYSNCVIGFVGVFVGDVEADPNWSMFKLLSAMHYGFAVA